MLKGGTIALQVLISNPLKTSYILSRWKRFLLPIVEKHPLVHIKDFILFHTKYLFVDKSRFLSRLYYLWSRKLYSIMRAFHEAVNAGLYRLTESDLLGYGNPLKACLRFNDKSGSWNILNVTGHNFCCW